jgi:hypothetical protein
MHMNRRVINFALSGIGLLFAIQVNSQPKVMYRPSRYYDPGKAELEDYKPSANNDQRARPWVVYSDREDNKTFAEANGTKEKVTIQFLDKFLVVGESNEFLHIAKDPEYNGTGEYLTSNWKDFGWIHKKNLLLWDKCLSNASKICSKAMVLNTFESLKDYQPGSGKQVNFFKKPGTDVKTDKSTLLFQIFFIYKKEGNFLLLGKGDKITDRERPADDVWGWVPKNRVNVWDTRNAIEPNSSENAANERRDEGMKARIFDDEPSAMQYKDEKKAEQAEWSDDKFDDRPIGDWRRFPLLETKDNGLLTVTFYGALDEATIKDQYKKAESQRKYNEFRAKSRTFNLIFVIDATKSMDSYFKPVADGIAESVAKLSKKNTMKFGAVAFRDFPEGEFLTEKKQLTADVEDFNKWILNVFSAAKNKNDNDAPEAVFYGMREALTSLAFSPDETNVMILIGDAGNNPKPSPSYVKLEEIRPLMVSKNVHLLVYQVHHAGDVAFDNFKIEAKNLLNLCEMDRYNSSLSTGKKAGLNQNKPECVDIGNHTLVMKNNAFVGRIVFCDKTTYPTMAPDRLQVEIANIVEEAPEQQERILGGLNQIFMDGKAGGDATKEIAKIPVKQSVFTSNFESSIAYAIKRLDLSNDIVQSLASERIEFSKKGYCPKRLKGANFDMFQSVLFLTWDEFTDLLKTLKKLPTSGRGSEARVNMQNTWLQLLKNHMGEISMAELAEVNITDAQQKVLGLPSKSDLIRNKKLADIIDPIKFPDPDFEKWCDQLERKTNKLAGFVQQSNYRFSFRSNDQTYFWILESELP